jgi:predicted acyl esterase
MRLSVSARFFTYDPMNPLPTTGGALLLSEEFRPGPLDQTAVEVREDVLVFTTEPLTEDVEVTGRVRAVLFAATDRPSTDWVARLCDVDETGVSRNVADGVVRVRAAVPGEASEHVVDLWSTSIVFRAGHRIRVQATSSNFPRGDRNLNTGEPEESATTGRVTRQQTPHAPPASSCPWCLQPDRERWESLPIRCRWARRRSSHVGSVEGRQASCGGGDDLPRAPVPRKRSGEDSSVSRPTRFRSTGLR